MATIEKENVVELLKAIIAKCGGEYNFLEKDFKLKSVEPITNKKVRISRLVVIGNELMTFNKECGYRTLTDTITDETDYDRIQKVCMNIEKEFDYLWHANEKKSVELGA